MPAEVRFTGPIATVDGIEQALDAPIRQGLAKLGDDVARLIIVRSPQYTGQFREGVGSVVTGSGLDSVLTVFDDAPDAFFVEHGRKAGKQPPVEPILAWVQFKGFTMPVEQQQRSITYAINKKREATGKHWIPFQALLSWVQQQGMVMDLGQQLRSIAFAVAKRIGERGLPGFDVFERIVTQEADLINRSILAIEKRVADILNA